MLLVFETKSKVKSSSKECHTNIPIVSVCFTLEAF